MLSFAPRSERPRLELSIGEALGLGGLVVIASCALCSLVLAQLELHDGRLALSLGLLTALGLGVATLALAGTPRVRFDRTEAAALLLLTAACAYFFLPGFPYAYADKDPGVYAAHAMSIAREGSIEVPDPVIAAGIDPMPLDGSRFPGIGIEEPGEPVITPSFYHLSSSLMATGHDVVGNRGVFHLGPVLAGASVALLFLASRRAHGVLFAGLAAALLSTSMMQVWQAKSPSSEMLAQLFVIGSLFALVLAIKTRWTPIAILAGAMLPIGFLTRPEGVIYVVLGVVGLAVAIASGRADRRAAAFAVGMAVLMPYAFYNAYGLREHYSTLNDVPDARVITAACGLALLGGAAVWLLRRDRAIPVAIPGHAQRWLGGAAFAAATLFLLGLWFREDLFGVDRTVHPVSGERFRTYDEQALHWLSWFVSVPGLVAMAIGIAVLLLRRWQLSLFVLILPGALLLPVYVWDPRITSRLVWWTRRFVPAVLPAMILLIALALTWGLLQPRRPLQLLAGATAAYLLVFGASQSVDLRDHHEMAGSWEMGHEVASVGGAQDSVFLFIEPSGMDALEPNRVLPGTVMLMHDRTTSVIPRLPRRRDVELFAEAFPSRSIYVVTARDDLPRTLSRDEFIPRRTVNQLITFWWESATSRPRSARSVEYTLTVWEFQPRGSSA